MPSSSRLSSFLSVLSALRGYGGYSSAGQFAGCIDYGDDSISKLNLQRFGSEPTPRALESLSTSFPAQLDGCLIDVPFSQKGRLIPNGVTRLVVGPIAPEDYGRHSSLPRTLMLCLTSTLCLIICPSAFPGDSMRHALQCVPRYPLCDPSRTGQHQAR